MSRAEQLPGVVLEVTHGHFAPLTPVHVNRVVQELRRAGLLELRKYTVFLPDLPRLKEVGDFDDLYLHQRETSATAAE